MEGTDTVRATSRARGVSPVALQPTSASTGDGSVSRYLPSQPTPEGELGSRRPPDVRALEVGPAGVRVARPLDNREPPLVEDVSQAGQPRMKAERPPIGVTADLQHLTGRNRDRRTPAEIERILIGHDRAQGIVAPAEIHHDEISAPGALGQCDVIQECRTRQS